MHNLIATAFKILFMSMMMMFILDMSLMVIDTVSVRNKIKAVCVNIEDEIVDNNCVPDALVPMFEAKIQSIVANSKVAVEYDSNLRNAVSINGTTYASVSEANVKDYGAAVDLAVGIKMQPWRVVFGANNGVMLRKVNGPSYVSRYGSDAVSCLRYLK